MEMKPGDKYCPIDTHPWEIDSLCKKEKCAWWIEGKGRLDLESCSIKAIAVSILSFVNSLNYKK